MINQPWANRNWYTWANAYTSGTNDILINLSENTTTIDLNQVVSWNIHKKFGGPKLRVELTVTLANGKRYMFYDDVPEQIFQTEAFFKAMADANLL